MQNFRQKGFSFLQRFSKALMIPFTFLPVASIFLGLSYWLSNFNTIANILFVSGNTILTLLPFIFIIAISYHFSNDKDYSIVGAGIISYVLFVLVGEIHFGFNLSGHLTAIIIAFIAVVCYEYFKKIKMPSFLILFEGRLFGVFTTVLAVFLLSFPFNYLLDFIIRATVHSGVFLTNSKFIFPGLFGFTSRLLIPTGMHHVWHNLFWFDTLGVNALPNYLLGNGNTNYLAGLYPIMLFGLPGAALAMIKTASKENKKSVTILLTSAILSSVLLGVTEPIEFSFLLVSPLLFLFHAIMTGISMIIVNLLSITIGYSFSAGLFEFLLHLKNPATNLSTLIYLIPVGMAYGLIYYFVFKYVINKFNLSTPGRSEQAVLKTTNYKSLASEMIKGLGGKENIKSLDYCATRLRLSVHDSKIINDDELKEHGALSVIRAGENIQVVIGPEVSRLASFFDSKVIKTKFKMPLKGTFSDISNTPDEVFAEGLLGPGFVVKPNDGKVVSPIDGTISMIYPTKHAIGITSKQGFDILIHIGIDTVNLDGQGYEALVAVGDEVKMGQQIMQIDIELLDSLNAILDTPVVFLQKQSIKVIKKKKDVYTIEVN